jgi:hypothetical protein
MRLVGRIDFILIEQGSSDFRWHDVWNVTNSWKNVWMKEIMFEFGESEPPEVDEVQCAICFGVLIYFGSVGTWDVG